MITTPLPCPPAPSCQALWAGSIAFSSGSCSTGRRKTATSATRSSPTSAASSSMSRTGPSPGKGRAGHPAGGSATYSSLWVLLKPMHCQPGSPSYLLFLGETGSSEPPSSVLAPLCLSGNQPGDLLHSPHWPLSSHEAGRAGLDLKHRASWPASGSPERLYPVFSPSVSRAPLVGWGPLHGEGTS